MCDSNQKKLCGKKDCVICIKRSFYFYDGKTKKGKLKIECWNYKLNILKPYEVRKKSNKKFWFICDNCNHNFNSSLSNISIEKKFTWCPYCSEPIKLLCKDNNCNHCFNNSFASCQSKTRSGKLIIDCFNKEKNNNLTPRDIIKCSGKKYYFKCIDCNHLIYKMINSINNSWCIFCDHKELCKNLNCNFCFNNSFASYQGKTIKGNLIIDCFNKEKNNNLTPRNIIKGTTNKYYFKCSDCNHILYKNICNITTSNNWCKYCTHLDICDNENCNFCFNNSFASYQGKTKSGKLIIDCYDKEKNNNFNIKNIIKGTTKEFYFLCIDCNHHIFKRIIDITFNNSWCIFCDHKKLCKDLNCNFCFNNSFASYQGKTIKGNLIIDCFDKEKNILTPRNIFKGTQKNYHFICKDCNNYLYKKIVEIACCNQWCKFCKNKTESKFKNFFNNKYFKYNLLHQVNYDWCKYKKNLPFDFVIEELKLIIEIDGEQHFTQVSNWTTPEKNLETDIFKMNKAINKGYTIIRILQEDIWFDKNNWKNKIDKLIIKHIEPTIFFIGSKEKYYNHKNYLN